MKCSLLTLSCYVDAELEDRRRGEMEAHLVGCARCRAGLSHIREEVDRIGALARVRVVDESAHALLVQLGLIELDDPLPERGEAVDDRSATLPPWLQGHAGAALPWTPERPARPAPAPRPPDDSTIELTGPPAAHRRLSALDGAPAPEVRPPLEWVPPPAPPADAQPPPPITSPAPTPSLPLTPSLPPVPVDAPLVSEPAVALPDDPPAAGISAAITGEPSTATPAEDAADHSASTPRGDSAVAVWTSTPAEAPPGADYPITDEDSLAEPLPVERFAPRGPAPAPRTSLVDRLRERLALRRAMGADVDDDTADHGVEIISGTGAPMHSRARSDLARRRAEALRPASAAELDEHPRREPGVREMLPPPARPASLESVDSLFDQQAPPAAGPARATPAQPSVDVRDVTGRPMMPRRPTVDARPPAAAPRWEFPRPAPDTDLRDATPASMEGPARRTRERSPSTARSGQRAAIAYAAAIAIIGAVGIVSGRTTTHIPPASTSGGTAAAPVAPPANTQAGSSSESVSSSASQPAAQAPAASVAPSVAPAPSAPTTIGSGGTGWSVQAIRVGDHGTYFRLVFDLGAATPGASGQPKVELTYPDAKTLVVTINGAAPSATPPSLGSSAIVTAIAASTPAPAGSAAYRIMLSKPGTGKPLYLANPLRLVIDVSAT